MELREAIEYICNDEAYVAAQKAVEQFDALRNHLNAAADVEMLMRDEIAALRKAAIEARELIKKLYDAEAIPTLMQYEVDGVKEALHRVLGKQQ